MRRKLIRNLILIVFIGGILLPACVFALSVKCQGKTYVDGFIQAGVTTEIWITFSIETASGGRTNKVFYKKIPSGYHGEYSTTFQYNGDPIYLKVKGTWDGFTDTFQKQYPGFTETVNINVDSPLSDFISAKFDTQRHDGDYIGTGDVFATDSHEYVVRNNKNAWGRTMYSYAKYNNSGTLEKIGYWGFYEHNDIRASSVTADKDGNVYVCGNTDRSLEGNTNKGHEDVFIQKYDSQMNYLWTRLLSQKKKGGEGDEYGGGIVTDKDGNFYVVGITDSKYLEGEKNPAYDDVYPYSSTCCFVTKYSSAGEQKWTRLFQEASLNPFNKELLDGIVEKDDNMQLKITADVNSNIYIAINTRWGRIDRIDSDRGGLTYYFSYIKVNKLSSDGSFLKDASIEPGGDLYLGPNVHYKKDHCLSHGGIAVDRNNNVYVAASLQLLVDENHILCIPVLIRIDWRFKDYKVVSTQEAIAGTENWASNDLWYSRSVVIDEEDYIYLAGTRYDSNSKKKSVIFLSKFDEDLNEIATRYLDGDSSPDLSYYNDVLDGMAINQTKNRIYFGGSSNSKSLAGNVNPDFDGYYRDFIIKWHH